MYKRITHRVSYSIHGGKQDRAGNELSHQGTSASTLKKRQRVRGSSVVEGYRSHKSHSKEYHTLKKWIASISIENLKVCVRLFSKHFSKYLYNQ